MLSRCTNIKNWQLSVEFDREYEEAANEKLQPASYSQLEPTHGSYHPNQPLNPVERRQTAPRAEAYLSMWRIPWAQNSVIPPGARTPSYETRLEERQQSGGRIPLDLIPHPLRGRHLSLCGGPCLRNLPVRTHKAQRHFSAIHSPVPIVRSRRHRDPQSTSWGSPIRPHSAPGR